MKRCFNKLRGRLAELDMGYPELARSINRSTSYVADRMRGVATWSIDECYAVLEAVGEPGGVINEWFPREVAFNGRLRLKGGVQ